MGSNGRSSSVLFFAFALLVSAQIYRTESTPTLTIFSDVGDVIDCVNISRQPAFADPLLKHHSIQLAPSSPLADLVSNSSKAEIMYQPWTDKGRCPEGTVPIARALGDESLRRKQSGYKIPAGRKYSTAGHEYAVTYQSVVNYGTQLNMNVWNPAVETTQMFSLAQLWITNGPSATINTIEAGWHVYPQLFAGDRRTRLFIYWTRDGYQTTGCYNLYCSGFVQVSQNIAPGAVLAPVSTYLGTQYYIGVLAYKDPSSGNWWLRVQNEWVGYWPKSIFTYLATNSNLLEWGGEIYNNGQTSPHTTTQMGSGRFPSQGGDGVSAYFSDIYYVDGTNTLRLLSGVGTITPSPGCYNVKLVGNIGTSGYKFYFGGPGKNAACP